MFGNYVIAQIEDAISSKTVEEQKRKKAPDTGDKRGRGLLHDIFPNTPGVTQLWRVIGLSRKWGLPFKNNVWTTSSRHVESCGRTRQVSLSQLAAQLWLAVVRGLEHTLARM
jgi:hypothetical protein